MSRTLLRLFRALGIIWCINEGKFAFFSSIVTDRLINELMLAGPIIYERQTLAKDLCLLLRWLLGLVLSPNQDNHQQLQSLLATQTPRTSPFNSTDLYQASLLEHDLPSQLLFPFHVSPSSLTGPGSTVNASTDGWLLWSSGSANHWELLPQPAKSPTLLDCATFWWGFPENISWTHTLVLHPNPNPSWIAQCSAWIPKFHAGLQEGLNFH